MVRWIEIPDFQRYSVSNSGLVKNHESGRVLSVIVNQQGLPYVGLMRNGRQLNRSLARLVASAFLDTPFHESWDTPINLNGMRLDNRSQNLMWRPRWFAAKYHTQIWDSSWKTMVEIAETGEIATVFAMASKYGLLPLDIFRSAVEQGYEGRVNIVWPTMYSFKPIKTHINTPANRRI